MVVLLAAMMAAVEVVAAAEAAMATLAAARASVRRRELPRMRRRVWRCPWQRGCGVSTRFRV